MWDRQNAAARPYCGRGCAVAVLLVAVIIIAVALLAESGLLYRYFLGPMVSDAENRTVNGIPEGYNLVNTLTYAVLFGLGLVALLRLLRRWSYRMDEGLLAASLPFFLAGGVLRTLEDAELFNGPLRYLFITPAIYFAVAGAFVLAMYAGKLARERPSSTLPALVAVVPLLLVQYAFALSGGTNFTLPLYQPLLFAALSVILATRMSSRADAGLAAVGAAGLFILVTAAAYLINFPSSSEWLGAYSMLNGMPTLHPPEMLIIPGTAAVLTALVYAMGRWPPAEFIAAPINLLMYFAHFLDGAATWRGIEVYGYSEKHTFPSLLIDVTSPLVMLPMKFILVTAIIVLLDRALADELRSRPQLLTGLKYAVVLLGLAPGVRDLLRIAFGV